MTNPDTEPREAAFFSAIRSWGIVRGPEGVLGGVISALGARVGLAAWPARLIYVLIGFFLFPVAMIAYAAGWALLPDAKGSIVIQDFGRGVMNVGALIGIGIFGLIGFFSFNDLRPWSWPWGPTAPDLGSVDPGTPMRAVAILVAVLIPLCIFASVIFLIVWLVRRSSRPQDPGASAYAMTPEQAKAAPAGGKASAATTGTSATSATTATMAPPRPPAPPLPPRVPGPGKGFHLATLAWAFIAAAVIAWCAREDLLSIYPVLAWGMLFYTGLGVILLAVSLSGRRLGFLGFLGFLGLLPAIILLAGHEGLLKAYDRDERPAEAVVEVIIDQPLRDVTEALGTTYETVFLGSDCYFAPIPPSPFEGSTARIAIPAPVTAVQHDILAATTTVTIPDGTSLKVLSDGDAQAVVYFEDQSMQCTFYGYEGTYIELTNPGDPVVTLTVRDDQTANLIILKEK